jgi:hypothetical protein
MPDVDDIWSDDEDSARFTTPPSSTPRLCRDIFETNVDKLIGDLAIKVQTIRSVRNSAVKGGDYWHTVDKYLGVLESAKRAAKVYAAAAIQDDDGG